LNTPPAGGNQAERNDFLFIQEGEAEDKNEVMSGGRDTISACRFLVLKCRSRI